MNVFIAYRKERDYEREVVSWMKEFEYRTGKKLEVIDPDSRDGSTFCDIYDLVEFPSVIALDSTGKMQNLWRGVPLPLMSEVSYYVQ